MGTEVLPSSGAHVLSGSAFPLSGRLHSALGGEMLWGSPIRGNAVVMYKV